METKIIHVVSNDDNVPIIAFEEKEHAIKYCKDNPGAGWQYVNLNLTLLQKGSKKTFICLQCKHELPLDFRMRTENYCYLCDPQN